MNPLSSVGIKTYIYNNQIKSMIILLAFPLLLMSMVWFLFYMPIANQPDGLALSLQLIKQYFHFILIGVGLWFLIAFAFHQSFIERSTGSTPVTRLEEPELYNLLENLCISRGITMPQLAIIESESLNAFASGISDKNYRITLTRGLVHALNNGEIEAVLAHELSHILHKDVRLLIISIIFVGMIGFAAKLMRSRFSLRASGRKNGAPLFLILIIFSLLGNLIALALRFSLSRKREYLADAGAVALTKNPNAMISALEKISGRAQIETMPEEVAQMCIEDARANAFSITGLFHTHPPIEKRIEALVTYAGGDEVREPAAFKGPWS